MINKSTIIYIFFIFIFIFMNEIYYFTYIKDILITSNWTSNYANLHDHLIYTHFIGYIQNGKSEMLVFGNNVGIASIYYILGKIFNTHNYIDLAHFVNDIVYCISSIYVFKIFKVLKFPLFLSIFFTFNPINFYFLSLINKDIFTILFVLMLVYYLAKKKYYIFFLVAITSVIIRIQLPLFAFVFYFLSEYHKISMSKKMLIVYLFSAIMAVMLEHTISIISMGSMGSAMGLGVTRIIRELNINYYIGSLFLNPVKIMQYFYDYLLAFKNIFSQDMFYFYRTGNFLNLIFLPISIFSVFVYFTFNRKTQLPKSIKYFLLVIVSFFTVWLINPTVNYRYIGIFIPYFLISGIYITKILTRNKQ